jgi:formylglycine-generating enzyme required for sulfatase activity
MAAKPPDAFLSYTRFNDQHDGGAISEFCRRLASAVQAVTGVPFEIFQDVGGIGIGEHWPDKLDRMLDQARFFIPMLTPSYFTSRPCREELDRFLRAEAQRGRNDLVLPIYYIESDVLEDEALRAADPLAKTLHERQRQDWRELRFESFEAGSVRRGLERLAREIVKARRRPMPPGSTPTTDEIVPAIAEPVTNEPSTIVQQSAEHVRHLRDSLIVPDSVSRSQPGTVFRDVDAPWCPELVVIPPGEFMMGSTKAEVEWAIEQGAKREWVEREKPQHLVRIACPLAVGRYAVTFEEYDHFARITQRAQQSDRGWGRGRRPVICLSFGDAKAFVAWLSVQAGHAYGLLSEAEWEYACRAGTTTRYWWDDEITPENANYGNKGGSTSEVGKYLPNPWGLYDTQGNVWEWVDDRWHDSYDGAPADGSAWIAGTDSRWVVRGGSWNYDLTFLRSASRGWEEPGNRRHHIGFRVARTLTAQPAASPVKDTHWSELEYHDPELTGQVTFNYSNNNGRYSIGRDEFFFETQWSKASDRSIHLFSDPPSIAGVAEASALRSYRDVTDLQAMTCRPECGPSKKVSMRYSRTVTTNMLYSKFLTSKTEHV